jgi:hypothetical protein
MNDVDDLVRFGEALSWAARNASALHARWAEEQTDQAA